MPNMEELIGKISGEITKQRGEIWMSKIDLVYAYGQVRDRTTREHEHKHHTKNKHRRKKRKNYLKNIRTYSKTITR